MALLRSLFQLINQEHALSQFESAYLADGRRRYFQSLSVNQVKHPLVRNTAGVVVTGDGRVQPVGVVVGDGVHHVGAGEGVVVRGLGFGRLCSQALHEVARPEVQPVVLQPPGAPGHLPGRPRGEPPGRFMPLPGVNGRQIARYAGGGGANQVRQNRMGQEDGVLVGDYQVPLAVNTRVAVVVLYRCLQPVAVVPLDGLADVFLGVTLRVIGGRVVARGEDHPVVAHGVGGLRGVPQYCGMQPHIINPDSRLRGPGYRLAQFVIVPVQVFPGYVIDVGSYQVRHQRVNDVGVVFVGGEEIPLALEARDAVVVGNRRLQAVFFVAFDGAVHVVHGVFLGVGRPCQGGGPVSASPV